jgi:anti-sigma factor RsiW
MTSQDSCLHVRQALGVYVVGAIDPAERSMVDMHLAGCPDCREELAGLAGLPALLGRIPLDEAAQLAGFSPERAMPAGHPDAGQPPELLTPLLAKMAQRRRVSRWRNLAAAAAVVVIAAGAALGATQISQAPASGGSQAGTPVGHWDSARGTTPGTGVTADVKYHGQPWGTKLVAQVSGIKPGTTCQFWVIGAHGEKWLAGSWTVASAWQNESYDESVAAPVASVHGFQITSGAKVLVQFNAH